MSELETTTFEEGYRLLKLELAAGTPPPVIRGETLRIEQIEVAEEVFQLRSETDVSSSEDHIRVLMEARMNAPHNHLDPICVWWSGKRWLILDGHHRLEAYKRTQDKIKGNNTIPARAFSGNLSEALRESTLLNSKDKLPVSREDKANRAWRMVVTGDFSKRDTALSTGIGSSTVARMRAKLSDIQRDYPESWQEDIAGLSWKEVNDMGRVKHEYGDDWQERQAAEWARRLGKTFGKKLREQPEVFFKALELYSPKLAEALGEYLAPMLENDDF